MQTSGNNSQAGTSVRLPSTLIVLTQTISFTLLKLSRVLAGFAGPKFGATLSGLHPRHELFDISHQEVPQRGRHLLDVCPYSRELHASRLLCGNLWCKNARFDPSQNLNTVQLSAECSLSAHQA